MIIRPAGMTLERALEIAMGGQAPKAPSWDRSKVPEGRGDGIRAMHADGASDRQIAERYGVTLRHASALRRKLGLIANRPATAPKIQGEDCNEGHPLTGDNLLIYTDQSGRKKRRCRRCQNHKANMRYRNRRGKN